MCPFELATGDGASEFDLAFGEANDFPVALARTAFDAYLLADFERIGAKDGYLMLGHC